MNYLIMHLLLDIQITAIFAIMNLVAVNSFVCECVPFSFFLQFSVSYLLCVAGTVLGAGIQQWARDRFNFLCGETHNKQTVNWRFSDRCCKRSGDFPTLDGMVRGELSMEEPSELRAALRRRGCQCLDSGWQEHLPGTGNKGTHV